MRTSPKTRIRMLCIVLIAALLLPFVQPVSAESGANAVCTAPVYRSTSDDAPVIGLVADGMVLKVVGQTGDYYEIDCAPMRGFLHESNVHYSLETGYVAKCDPAREENSLLPQYTSSQTFALRASLIEMGADLLGTPYVYGGTSPWGFDCSGFVSYMYKQHDISLHRCADEQMQDGLVVAREDLQVGDLVFFSVYGPWLASHVGIYVGNNRMIHAGSWGITYASLDTDYWANSYVGARRLVTMDSAWVNSQNEELTISAIDMLKE